MCADGSYYVGSTWDLERRVAQHNEGLGAARVADAYALEKQVQSWGRAKRRALIDGRYDALTDLASRSWAARRDRGALRPDELPPERPSVS